MYLLPLNQDQCLLREVILECMDVHISTDIVTVSFRRMAVNTKRRCQRVGLYIHLQTRQEAVTNKTKHFGSM